MFNLLSHKRNANPNIIEIPPANAGEDEGDMGSLSTTGGNVN
jgi:hypothetical protein